MAEGENTLPNALMAAFSLIFLLISTVIAIKYVVPPPMMNRITGPGVVLMMQLLK
ncbi:MAG: hypothetical protein GOV01_00570 [Candidatus Altiarchaeota archaeon]|nr:hypothetical protein [Candidatus Altiarchaeota archaeon]